MKPCYRCNQLKPFSELKKNKKSKDGVQAICKECVNAERRSRLPDYAEKQKAWRKNNPERYMLNSARRRAKIANIPFDLTVSDITIPETCPVFGTPLVFRQGIPQDDSPSLDRVIPSKGYVRGNVQVISFRANSLKRDASISELQAVLDYVKSELKG